MAPECPWPADNGLRNHGLGMIRSLGRISELSVIGYSSGAGETARWAALAEREKFALLSAPRKATGLRLRWNQVRGLTRLRPLTCSAFQVEAGRRAIALAVSQARLAGRPFDLIAFEMFWTCLNAPGGLPARTLLFPVDGYGLYWRRMRRVCPGWMSAARCSYLSAAFDRMESRDYPAMNLVATVAPADAESIARSYRGQIGVIPVPLARGIPPESRARVRLGGADPISILVAGFFENEAIATDTKRFLHSWTPRRDAELIVWGRGALKAGLGEAAQRAGARLVEWVDDPQTLLDRATVYVYPQRFACGVQTKVQEAMAAALCVVAGRDTLEPLGARDGVHALQADTPETAASNLQSRLESDPRLLETMGAAARDLARAEFTVDAVSRKLSSLLGWCLATS